MARKGEAKTGGRQKGTPNKATKDVRALAQHYAPQALAELGRLAIEAASEQARVAAIKELLDRSYGKSPQALQLQGDKDNPLRFTLADLLAEIDGKGPRIPSLGSCTYTRERK